MFASNLGTIDRIVRVVLGAALVAVPLTYPDAPYAWSGWIGLVPLVTGLVGWCGLYRLFGVSTRAR